MKIFFVYISVCCALCVTFAGCGQSSEATLDCFSVRQYKKLTLPAPDLYCMNVNTKNGNRTDVYVQLSYDRLKFEKKENIFQSRYTITFLVYDEHTTLVQTHEQTRTVAARSYEETQSLLFDIFMHSFSLLPGSYMLELNVVDEISKIKYRQQEKFTVNNFEQGVFSASSMLLLDTVTSVGKQLSLRPILPSSISFLKDSLGIFQEVYGLQQGDSVQMRITYKVSRKNSEMNPDAVYYSAPPYRIRISPCVSPYDSTYYQAESLFVAGASSVRGASAPTVQFYSLPRFGKSVVERTLFVTRNQKTGNQKKDSVVQSLQVFRKQNVSRTFISVNDVVDALRWILRSEEYDSLRALVSNEERQKILERFWEGRGGKQRRTEFDQRVRDANLLFTSCIEGSRTPMGVAYIVCGTPEYVECRSPYDEVWYYSIGNKVFALPFRMEVRGEENFFYELLPFSVDETLWQYFVERWRRK